MIIEGVFLGGHRLESHLEDLQLGSPLNQYLANYVQVANCGSVSIFINNFLLELNDVHLFILSVAAFAL